MVCDKKYFTFQFLSLPNQNRYTHGEFIETPKILYKDLTTQYPTSYKDIDLTEVLDLSAGIKCSTHSSSSDKKGYLVFSISYGRMFIEDFHENYLIETESEYTDKVYIALKRFGCRCEIIGERRFISILKEETDIRQGKKNIRKWINKLCKETNGLIN